MAVSSITVRTVDIFHQTMHKPTIQSWMKLKIKIKEVISKKKVKLNFFRILSRI
jgi:hypothetical protein